MQHQIAVKNKGMELSYDQVLDYEIRAGDILEVKTVESNVQYGTKMEEVFYDDEP